MKYTGVIIEESLKSKDVLGLVDIVKTKIEPVTEQYKTPWLKQWTLHTVEVDEKKADGVAELLGKTLGDNYWYADYKNDKYHYIVFPSRVFKVNRSKPEQYKDVMKHGLSLGIPDYQLDFSPTIKEWKRPKQ